MAQTILLFQMDQDRHRAVAQVCSKLNIRVIDVKQSDYAQKLGVLAQIQGFHREAKTYDGTGLPAPVLVFSEMNSDQVDAFLAEYRKTDAAPIGLKAVITAHNIFWNVDELAKELLREHLFMGRKL